MVMGLHINCMNTYVYCFISEVCLSLSSCIHVGEMTKYLIPVVWVTCTYYNPDFCCVVCGTLSMVSLLQMVWSKLFGAKHRNVFPFLEELRLDYFLRLAPRKSDLHIPVCF